MGVRPRVLIVTSDAGTASAWASWLRPAGTTALFCPGPCRIRVCPRAEGRPCSLREFADLAVIDLRAASDVRLRDGWTERLCRKMPDDGRTVFVHEGEIEADGRRVRMSRPLTPALLRAETEAIGGWKVHAWRGALTLLTRIRGVRTTPPPGDARP